MVMIYGERILIKTLEAPGVLTAPDNNRSFLSPAAFTRNSSLALFCLPCTVFLSVEINDLGVPSAFIKIISFLPQISGCFSFHDATVSPETSPGSPQYIVAFFHFERQPSVPINSFQPKHDTIYFAFSTSCGRLG